ncbi:uncharacterized protein LOC121369487 [Gigantopelta aegis]|uniref:uncharacterized protein LOC121369487 n=1 Tax=Gigantopelta aegis TaxID=1735272 RepID=UPI001B888E57|nr:uncharacterized protein LOC121369487 [Gigantopelta aegis]
MAQQQSQGCYNIVVCVDPSEHSEAAFKNYCENFSRKEHCVQMLHIMEWWGDGVWNMSPARLEECVKETNKTAEVLKAKYTQALAQFGLNGQFHKVEGKHAHVWHEVIQFAQSQNAKLIVMGCRGLGKLRKTIIGSNSDSVLHHSNIPVLVYKS